MAKRKAPRPPKAGSRPAPAAPGWVDREGLIFDLCIGVGMSRAEARREVRKVFPRESEERK